MNNTFEIKNGNSIPIHAPRIAEKSVNPYGCEDMRMIVTYCRGQKDIIEKYLSITPFEYDTSFFAIVFSEFRNYDGIEGDYKMASFIIPVRYKDKKGGYYLFTYNDNRDVIIRNREVFGYPDKYASIRIDENEEGIECTCHAICTGALNGKKLIHLSIDKQKPPAEEIPELSLTPDLLLKTMGNPEGEGLLYELALQRNQWEDFRKKGEKQYEAQVRLYGSEVDPLDEFQPLEVLGVKDITGDYISSEKNGWAQIIEEVYSIDDYFRDHQSR